VATPEGNPAPEGKTPAVGKPATEGDSPVIKEEDQGAVEGIFPSIF